MTARTQEGAQVLDKPMCRDRTDNSSQGMAPVGRSISSNITEYLRVEYPEFEPRCHIGNSSAVWGTSSVVQVPHPMDWSPAAHERSGLMYFRTRLQSELCSTATSQTIDGACHAWTDAWNPWRSPAKPGRRPESQQTGCTRPPPRARPVHQLGVGLMDPLGG